MKAKRTKLETTFPRSIKFDGTGGAMVALVVRAAFAAELVTDKLNAQRTVN